MLFAGKAGNVFIFLFECIIYKVSATFIFWVMFHWCLFYVFFSWPPQDPPAAVPPAQSNHPETARPPEEDKEKTVELLRMEQSKEIDCKTAQTEQHTSSKHTTPERCSERNDTETTCPSVEQLSFSKEVEMSKSPPLKPKDIKVMSTVHERPERIDQKRERVTCRSSKLFNSSNGRRVNISAVKSHESLDPLSSFMMLRTSRKSPVQTPRQSSPASAGTVNFIHYFCFHNKKSCNL